MPESPLPKTMKAVLLTGHGGLDRLEFRSDVPTPLPQAGDVLVRIGAAAVNNTDINTRIGWYSKSGDPAEDAAWTGSAAAFPRIQGADGCGRIVAVGAGVDAARLGERVIIDPVLRAPRAGAPAYFGSDCDGAFAQYARVPALNAHRVCSAMSDAELASFPCSYTAAENMLERARVGAGETVLVTGASGGVGSAAVQLARRRRARVIALADAAKADPVRALGAERILPRSVDLPAAVGRESVDAVIDVVGGRQFGALLEVLKRNGRYAVAGAIAGAIVELDLRTLYLKDLTLLGCTIAEPAVFANLIGYIERGEIGPVVAQTYPLEAIADAQRDFLSKRHTGKIVLLVPV